MKARSILFLSAIILVCSSCSKKLTYFTEDLHDEYNWSETQLKRVQFYISQDLVLYQSSRQGNSQIKDGQIQIKDRRKEEQIVIKRGTPGTLMFSPKEDRFAVSFDSSGDYLMFGPNSKARGRYVLLAKKWEKRGRGGIVSYGDSEYEIDSDSAYAALMVDMRKARKSVVKKETAGGRKVR